MNNVSLFELFSECNFESLDDMPNLVVRNIKISQDKKNMDIGVLIEAEKDGDLLKRISNIIQNCYRLNCVNLLILTDSKELCADYIESLRSYFCDKYPSLSACISKYSWGFDDDKITIGWANNQLERFESIKAELAQKVCTELGRKIDINLEGHICERDYELDKHNLLEVERKEVVIKTKKDEEVSDVIFGKITSKEAVTKMSEITESFGNITVEGRVFSVDVRESKAKNVVILKFDITDNTGSIRCVKIFNSTKDYKINVKVSDYVIVQGELEYNNYDNEIGIKAKAALKIAPPIRLDEAEEKRVELHMHSNMSAMNGVSSISSIVKMAKLWGHRAVAITDGGVAQAYPDAMLAGETHGVKILYGLEGYFIDDKAPSCAFVGNCSGEISCECICFDIETTGLNKEKDGITEIAAVLVSNGHILDRFHTYVNPEMDIPKFITELTGISNSTVENAPKIKDAINSFLGFCKDRVLVAHNAGFDMSFIMHNCAKNGIERKFAYIDTLEMARILLPGITRHKLNNVAKALKLGSFDHHKASEDADILAKIYIKFLDILVKEHGIKDISEINGVLTYLKSMGNGLKTVRAHSRILFAKNMEGLENLYRMISESHLNHFYRKPLIPISLYEKYSAGIIMGAEGSDGELFNAILSGKPKAELIDIAKRYDYIEIQPTANLMHLVNRGVVSSEDDIREINKKALQIGLELGKVVVAAGDAHFIEPHDIIYRKIVLHNNQGASRNNVDAPLYFRTTEDMLSEFSYLGDMAYDVVVKNTNAIADMIEDIRPIPKETYTPKIEGSAEELENLSGKTAHSIYGEVLPIHISQRMDKELKSIVGHGFDVMYIIAQKLVLRSIQEGYLVGSRGSVGSSLIAFLTGITEVNPMPAHYICPVCKYSEFHENEGYGAGVDMPDKMCDKCGVELGKHGFDIPFETFLGFDGDKAPDIDLNFSGDYQARAHRHTAELFGEDHVFRAGTIGTVAEKTAFGFVKKYLEDNTICASQYEQNRLTLGCTGIKRTTGQHPGGIMVVPKENSIYNFCPIQHPADDVNTDIITTHFDYHSIHDNLLKLDLLGHDDPTMIKYLHDLTRDKTDITPDNIPLDDEKTMKLFTDISVLGLDEDDILGVTGALAIPEFGTKFVREMLVDTSPKTFDDLVRISGLSHGTDVWLGNAQTLIKNGTSTLKDLICARDDIMNFLISKGIDPKLSFNIMENVRKGKGVKPEWQDEMLRHDVPDWYIKSCQKIKYMFPKAHAVAYVMMAFRIAWYKVHFPLEFYCAYFSVRAKGFDSKVMIWGIDGVRDKIKELCAKETLSATEKDMLTTLEVCYEMYRCNFTFHKMDLYKSSATEFIIDKNGLIPPFTSMPGIGETAAQTIISEREKGEFLSVEELVLRCNNISNSAVELLERAGALESIPKNNQLSFF